MIGRTCSSHKGKSLVRKSEKKRQIRSRKCRLESIVKMGSREIVWKVVNWV